MLAKGGAMLLAVLVLGAGLLAGAAQPAEAKMSNTAKVIAGFAAGFVLSEVLSDDHGRRGRHPQRYQRVGRYNGRPSQYGYDYRSTGRSVRIERRPVWRPQYDGRGALPRHAYRKGYRHGYGDGYRDGDNDCRCGNGRRGH